MPSEPNTPEQDQVGDVRESIDREKSRGMHPPKTVAEQVEQLDPGAPDSEHRRRDPLGGAEAQRDPDGTA
ncbi:MAG: hypothetical protein JWM86_1017 [Thermoleophilia bacterium]|nr:hypothetical protein [Thermoleophilia bacterium]